MQLDRIRRLDFHEFYTILKLKKFSIPEILKMWVQICLYNPFYKTYAPAWARHFVLSFGGDSKQLAPFGREPGSLFDTRAGIK